MATIYVSKRDGNNSNNGTTTSTPVADLWKAFDVLDTGAGSNGDSVEIIDSETYYVIGTGSLGHASSGRAAYPHSAAGSEATFKNFTLKAGIDPNTGLESYPVISGKLLNESGSASDRSYTAFAYQEGWTIQGLEIRDFRTSVAIPKTGTVSRKDSGSGTDSVAGDPTLIIKDCLIHHIPDRDGSDNGGNIHGCVVYASDCGDETTNVVENCIFYEIGYTVIGGISEEDVTIRNCLISNWGGNGTGNLKGIHLNSSGSVVEHCIISDYENKTNGTSAIWMGGKGTIRYTIANNITSDTANGVFYAENIQSCIANNCTTGANSVAASSGTVFNAAAVSADKIHDSTADPVLIWNSGSDSNGYFDSGTNSISSEEIGNFLNPRGSGFPPFYFTTNGGNGLQEATGSTVTRDLGDIKYFRSAFGYNRNRSRTSFAAECAPDIGCYEFYKEWSDSNGVTNQNIGDDFTINDGAADQLDNQYRVKLNDKACLGPARAPFSKTIKGVPNLRTLKKRSPYKTTKGS
tara:strand:- start:34 stop:1590 length:1557 start_codon:yes stop_codon:yes gene_type:complete